MFGRSAPSCSIVLSIPSASTTTSAAAAAASAAGMPLRFSELIPTPVLFTVTPPALAAATAAAIGVAQRISDWYLERGVQSQRVQYDWLPPHEPRSHTAARGSRTVRWARSRHHRRSSRRKGRSPLLAAPPPQCAAQVCDAGAGVAPGTRNMRPSQDVI